MSRRLEPHPLQEFEDRRREAERAAPPVFPPPRIYHGTSAAFLDRVLADGIQPRTLSGKSQWKGRCESAPHQVYLSVAYPFYFARCATHGKPGLVVEIDFARLNIKLLFPDEDFIAQAISRRDQIPIKKVHRLVRRDLFGYRQNWPDSLKYMGNCSYFGGIPPAAFTRYLTIDFRANPAVASVALDPTITILNYMFCGQNYRSLIAWAFGDLPAWPISPQVTREGITVVNL